MPNNFFQFKQFRIDQSHSGMKVTTDGCLFGAWVASVEENFDHSNILDIGTGTGLLTLMLAQTLDARFDAIEVSAQAYEEATSNFQNSTWSEQINCYHQPLQCFDSEKKYDLIICNPPFFKDNQKGINAERNAAIHDDFLSHKDLLKHSHKLLDNNGRMYLMLPQEEMSVFKRKAIESGLFQSNELLVRNQSKNRPLRVFSCFTKMDDIGSRSELIIKKPDGTYTSEFTRLLKDYYLYLD